ncbi:hypothetical protein EPO05_05745 [Patescibacteria group bacterium]|nr:MAG: hypothetical protein EPO05_05745 [Patescibacteria group bacterium]
MYLERKTKRATIIFVYILIFSCVGFLVYYYTKPKPSCSDGKRNQNEENVDCGGVCGACKKAIEAEPLKVEEQSVVYGGQGRYDMVAKISNPNTQFGSPAFQYVVRLKGSDGSVLAERQGTGFILPTEAKYVVEVNFESPVVPQSAEVTIESTTWQEFVEFREKPVLSVHNRRFSLIGGGGPWYSEVYGVLQNESMFDFNVVKVRVILRDASGNALAANVIEVRDVRSGEQRSFEFKWAYEFPGQGEVAEVQVDPDANVYDSENFMQLYRPARRFQELK